MVSGPASRPCPARSLRSATIRSAVSPLIAFGEVFGRRDRGSNAASPSARYRATSLDTQPCETPYARANSPWDRPSVTTAVLTRRAFDIRRPCRPARPDALRHAALTARQPAQPVFLCLQRPHSDVLRLDTRGSHRTGLSQGNR